MKIRTKIFVSYILIATLPLIVLGGFAYFNASKALFEQASGQLLSVADKSVEQIDAFIELCAGNVKELSARPVTPMVFYLSKFGGNLVTSIRHYRAYMAEGRPYIVQIRLIELDGNELLTTLDDKYNKSQDESRNGWFEEALTSEGVYVSDMHLCPDLNKPVVTMAKLMLSENGEKKGLLCLDIDGAAITSFVDNVEVAETGYGYIVDKAGLILAHPKKEKLLSENATDSESKSLIKALKDILSMKRGSGEYRYEGINKYVFYSPYKRLGWAIGITLPKQEFRASSSVLLRTILIIGFVVLVVSLGCSLLVSRSIINPIYIVRDAAIKIASGDLSQRIEVTSRDELGELVTSFNTLSDGLNLMVRGIRNTSAEVNVLTQSLAASAEEMSAFAQEVFENIESITEGITTQAKRIEEISKNMDEMNHAVKDVTTNAAKGAEGSRQTADLVQQGMEASEEAGRITSRIVDVADNVSGIVGGLGESSDEIGGILTVITELAEQTNLLALNAAIEAARAGEAGRGFAVVAEEVKKLAENSGQSAAKIRRIIRVIQDKAGKAIISVRLASTEVGEGKIAIEKVQQAFGKILKAAENTAFQAEVLTTTAESQSESTKKAGKAIDEVADIVETSVASSKSVQISLEEITKNMEEMSGNVQKSADIVLDLQELVKEFKLTKIK